MAVKLHAPCSKLHALTAELTEPVVSHMLATDYCTETLERMPCCLILAASIANRTIASGDVSTLCKIAAAAFEQKFMRPCVFHLQPKPIAKSVQRHKPLSKRQSLRYVCLSELLLR